jgi:DNA polymerase III delta prime subunit
MYQKLFFYKPEQVFLIQGDEKVFASLVEDVSKEEVSLEQKKLSRFTMEDAKGLVTFNLERGGNSWCVIYFDVFVHDAAQVLLKTLEEPREGIYVAFVTPHPYLIPQTIRSRARIVPSEGLVLGDAEHEPKYFASKKEVSEYIKIFGDEDIEASDRRAMATVFLDELEKHFRADREKAKSIYEAKEMLFKANMPTKQVVEFVVAMVY